MTVVTHWRYSLAHYVRLGNSRLTQSIVCAWWMIGCASTREPVEPSPPASPVRHAAPAVETGQPGAPTTLADRAGTETPKAPRICVPKQRPAPKCTVRNDTTKLVSTNDNAHDDPKWVAIAPGETVSLQANPKGNEQILLILGPIGTKPSYEGDALDGRSRNAERFRCGERDHWMVRYDKSEREYSIDRVPPKGGCELSRQKDLNVRTEVTWSTEYGRGDYLLSPGEKLAVGDHFVVYTEGHGFLNAFGGRCGGAERVTLAPNGEGLSYLTGKTRSEPWFAARWRRESSQLSVRGADVVATLPWGEAIPPGGGWYELEPWKVVLQSPPENLHGRVRVDVHNQSGDKDSVFVGVATRAIVDQLVSEIVAHPDGRAFPWAAPSTAGAPHPTLVVRKGWVLDQALSGVNCLERLWQTEYIALREDSERPAGTCYYKVPGRFDPQPKPRVVLESRLSVYEAKSGRSIARRTFTGTTPPACPTETTFQFQANVLALTANLKGAPPSNDEIEAWLRKL